ncbi:MAG: hypothetical protein JOZ24_02535 [Candidatus Eremiobacteraeota bacterium]|nr:hypothetical protein [Candidatus Eremiobacteraeota bacterium]
MPSFELTATVPSPRAVVMPRLLTVLRGYAERPDFALTVDLGVARAAMSVPVALELPAGRTASSVPLTLQACEHTDWFPVFTGEIQSEDRGPLASSLRLSGVYEVPLGALGTIVNRRVLRGAAERSLRAFAERLRTDVLEEIRRSELAVRQAEARGKS